MIFRATSDPVCLQVSLPTISELILAQLLRKINFFRARTKSKIHSIEMRHGLATRSRQLQR